MTRNSIFPLTSRDSASVNTYNPWPGLLAYGEADHELVTSCRVVYEGHYQAPAEGARVASPPVVGFQGVVDRKPGALPRNRASCNAS